jgi:hypothetical protein
MLSGHPAACLPDVGLARRKAAMNNFIAFAEVAGAIIAALGLALALEWVGLYGLTSLMPVRRDHSREGR